MHIEKAVKEKHEEKIVGNEGALSFSTPIFRDCLPGNPVDTNREMRASYPYGACYMGENVNNRFNPVVLA